MVVAATHGEIALEGAQRLDLGKHAIAADTLLAAGDEESEGETW